MDAASTNCCLLPSWLMVDRALSCSRSLVERSVVFTVISNIVSISIATHMNWDASLNILLSLGVKPNPRPESSPVVREYRRARSR